MMLSAQRAINARVSSVNSGSRRVRTIRLARATDEGKGPSTSETAASVTQEPVTPYTREFKSLGSRVIESNQPFDEPQHDIWEGEKFEVLGQVLEKWFLPGLVVLGLICGGIAAGSYNQDADVFIKPATSDETSIHVVPAAALSQPVTSQDS